MVVAILPRFGLAWRTIRKIIVQRSATMRYPSLSRHPRRRPKPVASCHPRPSWHPRPLKADWQDLRKPRRPEGNSRRKRGVRPSQMDAHPNHPRQTWQTAKARRRVAHREGRQLPRVHPAACALDPLAISPILAHLGKRLLAHLVEYPPQHRGKLRPPRSCVFRNSRLRRYLKKQVQRLPKLTQKSLYRSWSGHPRNPPERHIKAIESKTRRAF